MNQFSNIIIIGITGCGKSMFAGKYIASHSKARLIDGLHLNDPKNNLSEKEVELAECGTLIIDEIPYPPCSTLSDIFKYRIKHGKKNIILTQNTSNIQNLISEDISAISGLSLLTYGTDLDLFSSCIDIVLRIRSDRPIEFNLWKYCANTYMEDQDHNLSVDPEEWNSLLNHSSFWNLLLSSNLQCLEMNNNEEDMENGSVNWNIAKIFLERFIQDINISAKLKNSFKEILSWENTFSLEEYELGINFISSNTVK